MTRPHADVPYGTLDLMVLKSLAALGPLHGYAIARRIEQMAEVRSRSTRALPILRCSASNRKGGSRSDWGTSENNRRARYYAITPTGRRQLAAEADSWARTVAIVNRLLEAD